MKKIFIIIIILLSTGCEVEYNLSIGENYSENITIFYDEDYENSQSLINYVAFTYGVGSSETNDKISGVEYYNGFIGNNFFEYNYDFTQENFIDSFAANYCYNIYMTEDNGVITINTNNVNNCFNYYSNLDLITINIVDELNQFSSTNASSVSNNIYSWTFNSDDSYNSYIEIKIEEDLAEDNYNENNFSNTEEEFSEDNEIINYMNIFYVIISFFLVFTIIVYLKSKGKLK